MYVADSKRLSAAGAKKIMPTALTRAGEAGIAVTIAIVDSGGHLILLERMEGGKFHTVHSPTTKAGAECIGGIGVAGGNFEFDERVAREAADSIK